MKIHLHIDESYEQMEVHIYAAIEPACCCNNDRLYRFIEMEYFF